ncbi:hypothetical protein C1A50_2369 [Paenibacillus polymyxa]|nr:hypothetical protein C1A50_2369 [Paenibacillus polymyxa]
MKGGTTTHSSLTDVSFLRTFYRSYKEEATHAPKPIITDNLA